MLCSEVMNREVRIASERDEASKAAKIMKEYDIGFVPVCDADRRRLVGTLTDRDIAVRLVADGKAPNTPVHDIMSPQVVFCHDDDDVTEARELMEAHQLSRMIVLDNNEQISGIISLGDLAGDDATTETLEVIKQR